MKNLKTLIVAIITTLISISLIKADSTSYSNDQRIARLEYAEELRSLQLERAKEELRDQNSNNFGIQVGVIVSAIVAAMGGMIAIKKSVSKQANELAKEMTEKTMKSATQEVEKNLPAMVRLQTEKLMMPFIRDNIKQLKEILNEREDLSMYYSKPILAIYNDLLDRENLSKGLSNFSNVDYIHVDEFESAGEDLAVISVLMVEENVREDYFDKIKEFVACRVNKAIFMYPDRLSPDVHGIVERKGFCNSPETLENAIITLYKKL